MTCKRGFIEQKLSIHGVLWKISEGRTFSLLILVFRSRQINQWQLIAATADLTAKISYTNCALFSFSQPLSRN